MFRNAKIRTKLFFSIGLIILLATAVVVTLLGQMTKIADNTQRLYHQPYTAANNAWAIRRNLVDSEGKLYKLLTVSAASSAAQTIRSEMGTDTIELSNAISNLRAVFFSEDKIRLLDEIDAYISQAKPIQEQVLTLISGGRTQDAYQLLSEQYEPIFDACNQKVLELYALTSQDATSFAEEAARSARASFILGVSLLAAGIIAGVVICILVSNALTIPLQQLEYAAREMSKGNLKVVDKVTYQSKDEMGNLADSLRITMTNLAAYVDEISDVLLRLSKGDLTVPSGEITDFLGDFSEIKSSFVTILKSFNSTLGEIGEVSAQVDAGSGQVSDAAQNLSEGATEQASAIEELTATVEEISAQISQNAENAQTANEMTSQVSREVAESNHQMSQMMESMREISSSSEEIGKIIATIENIAFQTNILALNAAVEAARAGEAGKGFAVVADEVRNLANKTSEASKNTASLIQGSVSAVEKGVSIAQATAQALDAVADTTGQVVGTVEKIATASARQASAVAEVTSRVEQISSVVQTNSATSEESAAASAELAKQADLLNRLVARFVLYRASAQTQSEFHSGDAG